MNWTQWRSLWRFDVEADIPHLSVTVMTPYCFARVLWYATSKEFKAWPNTYDTGIVLGWRWPWRPRFKEWARLRKHEMPLAIYGGPMDEVYLIRAIKELRLLDRDQEIPSINPLIKQFPEFRQIPATVNSIIHLAPRCAHNYWVADCQNCAAKALRLAVMLKTKYEPAPQIDPFEPPIVAFRRREAEAQKRLQAAKQQLEAGDEPRNA